MEWKAVRYGAVGAAVLGLAAVTLATLLTYHFAPCPGMTPKEGREGRGLFREDFPIFAPPDPPKDLRLPRHLFPLEYHLRLMPKFDPVNGFPIDGRVEILVECRENGRNVTLHARNMTFYEVRVLGSDREFDVLDVEYDNERSFVILHLDQDLVANESYAVLIEFRAELTTDLAGLYRSTYREQNFTRYDNGTFLYF
ncbi:unnamed protein product [Darwinula stevensoni]|uniref:Aminopeptidase N-like N-terminal domain-containing protein n=1 Tax=Darwinula stevensoni TaxID=69355 RepID=A0A7R8XIN7_9CRUS|nr:unnamed protein product [Darwinula stevensoni]CAG0894458.1 unnamed protein product [Darwinula stevensoni]